jgi:hypothetical protein
MIAPDPPPLPPGYMALAAAIERAGCTSIAGWTGDERLALEAWGAVLRSAHIVHDAQPELEPPPVPPELAGPVCRYIAALKKILGLCAYGAVPSALLDDDFAVHAGIPPKYWLAPGIATMRMWATGRTTIDVESRPVAGWVMIDSKALNAALADHAADRTDVAPAPASADAAAIQARPEAKRAAKAAPPKHERIAALIAECHPPGQLRPDRKTLAARFAVSPRTITRAFSVLRRQRQVAKGGHDP